MQKEIVKFDEVLGKEVPVHRVVTPAVEKEIVLKNITPQLSAEEALKIIGEHKNG